MEHPQPPTPTYTEGEFYRKRGGKLEYVSGSDQIN